MEEIMRQLNMANDQVEKLVGPTKTGNAMRRDGSLENRKERRERERREAKAARKQKVTA